MIVFIRKFGIDEYKWTNKLLKTKNLKLKIYSKKDSKLNYSD